MTFFRGTEIVFVLVYLFVRRSNLLQYGVEDRVGDFFFKLVEIFLGGLRFFRSNRDFTGRGVALLHGEVKGFFERKS